MFVTAITADNWKGVNDTPERVEGPSWNDIEVRIRALDGGRRTIVSLEGEEGAHLIVGGGGGGRYVVSATLDNVPLTLVLTDQVRSKVKLYVGGQDGEYPDNIVVDIATAMTAARTFAECGQLTPEWLWQAPKASR